LPVKRVIARKAKRKKGSYSKNLKESDILKTKALLRTGGVYSPRNEQKCTVDPEEK